MGRFVTSSTNGFNTASELRELEEFYALHKAELGTATRATESAIQNAKNNIAWMENYYAEIDAWLEDNLKMRAE